MSKETPNKIELIKKNTLKSMYLSWRKIKSFKSCMIGANSLGLQKVVITMLIKITEIIILEYRNLFRNFVRISFTLSSPF